MNAFGIYWVLGSVGQVVIFYVNAANNTLQFMYYLLSLSEYCLHIEMYFAQIQRKFWANKNDIWFGWLLLDMHPKLKISRIVITCNSLKLLFFYWNEL